MNSNFKGGQILPNDIILNDHVSREGQVIYTSNTKSKQNINTKNIKGSCQICDLQGREDINIENLTLPANTLNLKENTQCKYLGKNLKEMEKIGNVINYLEDIFPDNADTAKEMNLEDCIKISNIKGLNYKVLFRPLLNSITPILHNSCFIGEWDGKINMPPSIIEEKQELINIMRNNWAKDMEILVYGSQNISGIQSYNQEYCMDGITLNYLINPNSPQNGFQPSLEYPGNKNEIGFFAPRINLINTQKSMMGYVLSETVTEQIYAYNNPLIIQSLLDFFGYTQQKELELRSLGKSSVQRLLCSLATPRPGGAPSPLEYVIINKVQGIIENKHYNNDKKKYLKTKDNIQDAENKKKQFLDIVGNINSNTIDNMEKVSEIKGKFLKSSIWWSSVIDIYTIINSKDIIEIEKEIFNIKNIEEKSTIDGMASTGNKLEIIQPMEILDKIKVSFNKKIEYIKYYKGQIVILTKGNKINKQAVLNEYDKQANKWIATIEGDENPVYLSNTAFISLDSDKKKIITINNIYKITNLDIQSENNNKYCLVNSKIEGTSDYSVLLLNGEEKLIEKKISSDKLQTIDCNSIQNCNIPSKDLKNILSTLYLKGGFLNLLQHVDNMNERESILKKILDLLNTFKVDDSRTHSNFGGNKKTRNKKKRKKNTKKHRKKISK